jgi:hypothetical protein
MRTLTMAILAAGKRDFSGFNAIGPYPLMG